MREPGGGCFCWSQRVPPSPSRPHVHFGCFRFGPIINGRTREHPSSAGGGRWVWHALGQIRRSESSGLTALAVLLLRDMTLPVRDAGAAAVGARLLLLVGTMRRSSVCP